MRERLFSYLLLSMLMVGCVTKKPSTGLMEHRLVSIPVDLSATTKPLKDNEFPRELRWASKEISTEYPFTELLPSWNVDVPPGEGVNFDVRVRDHSTGKWSPWLHIGYWGQVTRDGRVTKFAGGAVAVDVLELDRPADAFQIRSTFMDFTLKQQAWPTLRSVNAVYSRPLIGKLPELTTSIPPSVDIDVPFRAQGVEDASIKGSICSPTSTSMVMQWAGVDRSTCDNAMAIYDFDNAIFGNWNRAVQYAASMGLESHLERFTTMDQVRERLAQGQPIIASINFKKGTFPSNVLKSTKGHLIVVRGYTESGDMIINDPASKDLGHGIKYRAEELANAWLVNTGGVGYIIKNGKNMAEKPQ